MRGDADRSTALHPIIKAEETKQMYAKLRYICKGKQNGGISRVLVPDTEEEDVDPKA
jgi:hypothetical protein